MRTRVITAVIALAIFLPILFIGGTILQLTAALLAVIGVYELFRMRQIQLLSYEGVLAALGAIVLVLPKNPWFSFLPVNTEKWMLYYFVVMLILGLSVISKNTYTFDEAWFPVLVSLYVGVGFGNFVSARMDKDGLIVLMFAFLVVWSTDIGAYMFGRKYGKNKLWPEISPNKTVEGALGGILSAVVVAVIYLIIFPAKQYFDHSLFTVALMTIVLSVVGQFGDLVESAFKRHYGVKDSGKILPGHGGILDRFDSMLFVFPIMHLLGLI